MLTPEQLAGLVTAIAALIGALGLQAIREGRRERERGEAPPVPLTRERFDEEIGDLKALIRARAESRDARDRLIQTDTKLGNLRRH